MALDGSKSLESEVLNVQTVGQQQYHYRENGNPNNTNVDQEVRVVHEVVIGVPKFKVGEGSLLD